MRNAPLAVLVPGRAPSAALIVGLIHRCFEPHLEQMQYLPVYYPARHRCHELCMRNAAEIVRQIRIDDLGATRYQQIACLLHRGQRTAFRSITMLLHR